MSVLSIRQVVVAAVFSMLAAGAVASPANLEPRVCCGNAANCPAHCVRVSYTEEMPGCVVLTKMYKVFRMLAG